MSVEARRRLRGELSAFGPFVAIETHAPGDEPQPPWLSIAELIDDPALLDARVEAVGLALAQRRTPPPPAQARAHVSPRVAASVTHLGIVARLLSPVLVARAIAATRAHGALEHGTIDLNPRRIWWQNTLGGAVPLSYPVSLHGPALTRDATDAMDVTAATALVTPAVEALTEVMAGRYRLGSTVAWGNVGSAANGAVTSVRFARPELEAAARAVADRTLADPRIDGGRTRSGPRYRRRSCCLIYQVAGTREAVCGDCVLQPGTNPRSGT